MKIYFTCALLVFYGFNCISRGLSEKKGPAKVIMGLLLMATGGSVIALTALKYETIAAIVMMFGVGFTILTIALSGIFNALGCSECVVGTFKGYITEKNYSYPIFEYEYGGERYEQESIQYIWRTDSVGSFQEDFQYDIYISPRMPRKVLFVKKVRGIDLFLLLVGTVFIGVGVWLLLKDVFSVL
ncbi:MAG: hypothetical protein IJ424_00460 [Oscillospiraceae bacterium]|nr:hypothetical protein [Oscillospiraceae bacterium]